MADLLMKLNQHRASGWLTRALGLPQPVELARATGPYEAQPFAGMRALLRTTDSGYATDALREALQAGGASWQTDVPAEGTPRVDIIVMDATGCRQPADCRALYDAFQPLMRRIAINGRILIVATNPAQLSDPAQAAVARGIEGFMRSLAKEVGARGITANLAYVEAAAVSRLQGVVRFFCGKQSTYVTGQVLRLSASVRLPEQAPLVHTLAGKIALVTGAARGIGRATAERLAQEGAQIVALDVPAVADDLHELCTRIGALPLMLDIAAHDTPEKLAQFFMERYAGIDIVVHNAGVTRDRTLAKMSASAWDLVLDINLAAILAVDAALLARGLVRDEARIVCVSSMSGIAGNFGQTNYATSKAALTGYVAAQAPVLAGRGICINAIAPGFIETAMTDAMPFLPREIGRRLNSLKQGGKPRDVAELITFLCSPGVVAISGQTVRVCGQAMMGA